ncbi:MULTISPECIES: basic amino acid ABC transporter substrate-binding protein [Heyndrickxia]|jgi:polar amino acid transport system substrate-binding protein|uniref:Basic amino acid ABC transporter substrate-binding protein n=1 Tax=Heyndrickxia oleronia TaxID=38875 RepID=A0A8E2I5G5_9BACI|nr:basic amino acid ABC transporter substrate-binding protein [Heyndrickxia oleronia]NYV68779.1 basic amino acid ABC transporter substrate-binding protein [Bacillus sp. Gen3]OJH18516.1 basic amino acid ABC transporter substrate-binding protein [Bacillus obstructivus]MBU5211332.1 basic amino acid ABC transporter substrate-binding protein [Heyndrickxia oleronia]MCI1590786.1 basic amino acid ABC transporter substrate-binding protein [Heyndrickxia oleronia]MCI1612857.1 basic amino acid ABC transpo
MYKMTAKISMVLIVCCIFILSACGQGSKEANSNGSDNKTLSVGTEATFAPFEFMKKGKVTGFDVDLLNAVAKEAGYEVKIKNTGWDTMMAGVQDESIDIGMAGITINKKRLKTYDFSHPYFESINMIVAPKDSPIENAKDLKDKRIGVQNGTTGQMASEALFGENNKNILKYETSAMAFMALENGDVEAVVTDYAVAKEYVEKNPDKNVKTIDDRTNFTPEYYGIMFHKDSKLKAKFDQALNKILDDGTYTEIYKKWFGTEPDVDTLKAAQEK